MEHEKDFKFSAGPWNLHPGADPFGPTVRPEREFAEKLKIFRDLGFDYVSSTMTTPCRTSSPPADREKKAQGNQEDARRPRPEGRDLSPRAIWEACRTGSTARSPATMPPTASGRIERGKRAIDVGRVLGTDRFVWWPAREGTYIRESKDAVTSFNRMLEFVDAMLDYDKNIRILGEMKPNEPMDLMYLPTTGHFLALAYKSERSRAASAC